MNYSGSSKVFGSPSVIKECQSNWVEASKCWSVAMVSSSRVNKITWNLPFWVSVNCGNLLTETTETTLSAVVHSVDKQQIRRSRKNESDTDAFHENFSYHSYTMPAICSQLEKCIHHFWVISEKETERTHIAFDNFVFRNFLDRKLLFLMLGTIQMDKVYFQAINMCADEMLFMCRSILTSTKHRWMLSNVETTEETMSVSDKPANILFVECSKLFYSNKFQMKRAHSDKMLSQFIGAVRWFASIVGK